MVAHIEMREVEHVRAARPGHPEQVIVVVPVQEAARDVVAVLQPHEVEVERPVAGKIRGLEGGKLAGGAGGKGFGQARGLLLFRILVTGAILSQNRAHHPPKRGHCASTAVLPATTV
ncbi:hypothetical protein D3C72_1662970 [compost metagenome]